MMCHDQHLDRRVLAQASTLMTAGHRVELLALSQDNEDHHEVLDNGLAVHQIGLARIMPENPIYKSYLRRHQAISNIVCNKWKAPRMFDLLSRANWKLYIASLYIYFQNRNGDPLPFRRAFVQAAQEHEADVIHVHDLPALEAGAEVAEARGIPLVYDAHELYPEQVVFSRRQKQICAENEKKHVRKGSVVFAVNRSIAEEMSRRYGIPEPVVLLNAIDPPESFDPKGSYDLLREKIGLGKDRRILLYQGGFSPNRNLENLVRAMSLVRTKDVDLVMMGFGDIENDLKLLAGELGLLGKRVYFIEAVPYEELLQHSASADAGIIPYPHVDLNSYYCTPNKLFEFIQARLPILANDSPELRRFVANNGFGINHRMDGPEDIAAAIDGMFAGAEKLTAFRRTLGERASLFTWRVEEKKLLHAYRRVLHCPPGGLGEVT